MRVLCINSDLTNVSKQGLKGVPLVEGDIYTVVGEMILYGVPAFRIAERMFCEKGRMALYAQYLFVPLSEISETEYSTIEKHSYA